VSILLACYAGVFVVRLTRYPGLFSLVLASAALSWLVSRGDPWPVMHLVTFFVAFGLGSACRSSRHLPGFLIGAWVLALIGARQVPSLSYTGATLLLLAGAGLVVPSSIRLHGITEYYYEYYLVHGVFLYGMVRLARNHPACAVAAGVALSALGAFLLRHLVLQVQGLLANRCVDRSPGTTRSSIHPSRGPEPQCATAGGNRA
jgi:hypothetical protein